jgi:hypothetical protein
VTNRSFLLSAIAVLALLGLVGGAYALGKSDSPASPMTVAPTETATVAQSTPLPPTPVPPTRTCAEILSTGAYTSDAERAFFLANCNPTATPIRATSIPTVTPSTAAPSCPTGCVSRPPDCLIKGNISQITGEKIYHVPGGEFYEATIITPADGELWFCRTQEAIANGWRQSER